MLETHNRQLFLESIRPPVGYELDFLVGTTYSLDLVTLLTLPLTFTMFDSQDESGKPLMDPLMMLEALRRNADKMDIFCQAGHIYLPKQHRGLFTYLEHSVHEVVAPHEDGVFHPKVWVGRYVSHGQPIRYKVLVQSRNLTFDRSWDVMACLDGEVIDRKNAISRNHPLGDFIQALPDLTVHPLSETKTAKLELIQYELKRLQLDFPEGVEDIKFHPLGIKGHQAWPFDGRIDRMLVISPFLTGSCLEDLAASKAENVLISRQESLTAVELRHLAKYGERIHVLMDEAAPEASEEADEGSEQFPRLSSDGGNAGLHAKVYVADEGWNARTWLGSANATHHAFHRNVEFLIEMRGKKRLFGVQSVLGHPDNKWSLSHLLKPYQVLNDEEVQETESDFNNELEQYSRVIAATEMVLYIGDSGVRDPDGESGYTVTLRIPKCGVSLAPEVRLFCKLISLPDVRFQPVSLDKFETTEVKFSGLTMDALTSFVAFRIEGHKAGVTMEFVCNVKLVGEPESRRDRLLKSLLTNKAEVLRYILLLLSEGDGDPLTQALLKASEESDGMVPGATTAGEIPLFESILKTLHSQPAKLELIQYVIEQLRVSGTEDLLPEGFLDVWDPIWEVAKEALLHS